MGPAATGPPAGFQGAPQQICTQPCHPIAALHMHAQMPARAQARRNPTWLSATGGTDSGEPDTQGSSTPRIQVDLAPETPSTPSQEDSSSNNFSTTAARLAAEVFASPIFYIVAGRRCAGQPWRWNALGTFVLVPYAPQHPATICSTPTPALPTIHTPRHRCPASVHPAYLSDISWLSNTCSHARRPGPDQAGCVYRGAVFVNLRLCRAAGHAADAAVKE